MSMGGPGEPESLIRADSLAFLSHGSPGGGTLPFIGVSFARFPRRWNPTFHWRFFRTVPDLFIFPGQISVFSFFAFTRRVASGGRRWSGRTGPEWVATLPPLVAAR
jgi:hypothetical protein